MAGPTRKEYDDLLKGHSRGIGAQAWQKPAMDRTGQDTKTRPNRRIINYEGIHCDKLSESTPDFSLKAKSQAPCEKVINSENNSWIVLGRDRHRDKYHNDEDPHYGGRGDSHSGMIDIVVGRMGKGVKEKSGSGRPLPAHPNFIDDSARIYISQKSDIDRYFNLGVMYAQEAPPASSTTGPPQPDNLDSPVAYMPSIAKSAIGLKADAIRIIGREGVKIISSMDPDNSHGHMKQAIHGIELICAGNGGLEGPGEKPVALAKAPQLALALVRVVDLMSKLNGIVDSFLMSQMELNTSISTHTHFSPFFGAPTSPSVTLIPASVQALVKQLVKAKASLFSHKQMCGVYEANYCKALGDGWFGSKYHKCN